MTRFYSYPAVVSMLLQDAVRMKSQNWVVGRSKTGMKRQMTGTQAALGWREAGLMNLKWWIIGMETALWDTEQVV